MGRKLQKYVFVLLLILLPTQLGLHFWPNWAYISGIRVDYFSPTLYLTDLLILLLVFLEIRNFKLKSKSLLIYCFIGLLLYLNVTQSLSPSVSLYKWLKVAEFGFLIWFVARNVQFTVNKAKLLLIPIVYESILAVWQFVNQGSVGGLWWWLGERTFNGGTPGIANAAINGQLVLRPYATFPHPNVLAGFLIVSILLVIRFSPHISRKITVSILVLGLAALSLTFSRLAVTGLLRTEGQSFTVRGQLNRLAIDQWLESSIIGSGLGTSPLYPIKVTNYALLHQPTHNIYLLVLGETGILGVLGLLGILWTVVRRTKIYYPLYAILFLGLFDHYFLTLQQGQLLLALVLGMGWGLGKKGKIS